MKISNETKVGILATVAIVLFIFGYNFLKGKDLFTESREFHAVYSDIDGLSHANKVVMRGFTVGQVNSVDMDPETFEIHVSFTINKNVNIPVNSKAKIVNIDLFGTKGIELVLGNSTELANSGDTLLTEMDKSFNALISEVLNPLIDKITKLTGTIDTTINVLVQGELTEAIANVNKITKTVDSKLGVGLDTLNMILNKASSLITSLKSNEGNIQRAISNFADLSDTLSGMELQRTLNEVNAALVQVNQIVTKINKGEGSLGLLVNNEELYRDLDKTVKDLDALIIRLNDKPIDVDVHLFGGKKDKKKKD